MEQKRQLTLRRKRCFGLVHDSYEEEHWESEEDVARGEGFWIDDDGNWVPMDEE